MSINPYAIAGAAVVCRGAMLCECGADLGGRSVRHGDSAECEGCSEPVWFSVRDGTVEIHGPLAYGGPDWSEPEKEVLRAVYPVGGGKACERFLSGRPRRAIVAKANKMGLVSGISRCRRPPARSEETLSSLDGAALESSTLLEQVREAAGLTRKEVGSATGYDVETIAHAERARHATKLSLVHDVLEYCGFELVLRRRPTAPE